MDEDERPSAVSPAPSDPALSSSGTASVTTSTTSRRSFNDHEDDEEESYSGDTHSNSISVSAGGTCSSSRTWSRSGTGVSGTPSKSSSSESGGTRSELVLEPGKVDKISVSDLQIELLSLHEKSDDERISLEQCSNGHVSESDVEPDSLVEETPTTPQPRTQLSSEREERLEIREEGDSEGPSSLEMPSPRFPPRMSQSRASIDSRGSLSYFVDLNESAASSSTSRKIEACSPRFSFPPAKNRSIGVDEERMSQSMYVRSDSRGSQGSSVSFFVDFSPKAVPTKGETARIKQPLMPSAVVPAPLRKNSQSKCAKRIEAFFRIIEERILFLAEPCYSKDEVRKKKGLAEKISEAIVREEDKILKGHKLSKIEEVKAALALVDEDEGSSKAANPFATNSEERPTLRRERTFDLDPGKSVRDVKVVEINLDETPTSSGRGAVFSSSDLDLSPDEERDLQFFQQAKILHIRRLKRELEKLDKIEREMAMKASFCGPEPMLCWTDKDEVQQRPVIMSSGSKQRPVPVPRPRTMIPVPVVQTPKRPSRKCDTVVVPNPPVTTTEVIPIERAKTAANSSSCGGNNFTTLAVSSRKKNQKPEKLRVKKNLSRENSFANQTKRPQPSIQRTEENEITCSWFVNGKSGIGVPNGVKIDRGQTFRVKDESSRPRIGSYSGSKLSNQNGAGAGNTGLRVQENGDKGDGSQTYRVPKEDSFLERSKSNLCESPSKEIKEPSLFQKFKQRRKEEQLLAEKLANPVQRSRPKPKPQAYFISCDEDTDLDISDRPLRSRSKTIPSPKIIELERKAESEGETGTPNLQEALKARRPDYISRTQEREHFRLAKKLVSSNRNAIFENIPSDHHRQRSLSHSYRPHAKRSEVKEKTAYTNPLLTKAKKPAVPRQTSPVVKRQEPSTTKRRSGSVGEKKPLQKDNPPSSGRRQLTSIGNQNSVRAAKIGAKTEEIKPKKSAPTKSPYSGSLYGSKTVQGMPKVTLSSKGHLPSKSEAVKHLRKIRSGDGQRAS